MNKYKFVFMMWGQRCETQFATESDALSWVSGRYADGWLKPVELSLEGVIVYNEQAFEQYLWEHV